MKNDSNQMYELCKEHMHSYVLIETVHGDYIDGIMTGLDEEHAYLAVPIEAYPASQLTGQMNSPYRNPDQSDFQSFSYGYGGYGFGGGYRPPNRFRRLILPLAAIAGLTLLAWY